MNFEKKLLRLEHIVQKMEKGELSLEESLALYEEGIKLTRECQTQLTEAEEHVKKLSSIDANGQPTFETIITTSSASNMNES